jgi:hypothetical protein
MRYRNVGKSWSLEERKNVISQDLLYACSCIEWCFGYRVCIGIAH